MEIRYPMDLEKFIRFQSESDKPFMCVNKEHLMPLVAAYDLDREVELKCYTGDCDFKVRPGMQMYDFVLEELDALDNQVPPASETIIL